MKQLILYGFNSLTREIVKFCEREKGYHVSYICVDKAYLDESDYQGLPFIAFEDLHQLDMSCYEVLITFGYSKMNEIKRLKYNICKQKNYKMANFISERAMVYTDDIGDSNIIMPNVVISNGVSIGNCNTFYPSVVVGHDCNIGSFNFIASCADILGMVNIGDQCFVGGNSTIVDGKSLANCSLVGAGAVVAVNTQENQVIVPNRSILLERNSHDFY